MQNSQEAPTRAYQGTDSDLTGLVLGIVAAWMIPQTFNNLGLAIGGATGLSPELTNTAVSLSSLITGMLIVMWGNLADYLGRVRLFRWGTYFAIAGSLLIAFASSGAAPIMVIAGRILQGLGQGALTPAALALVKRYWEGAGQARAISFISIGTFGGSAFAAAFGGAIAGSPLTWRGVFVIGPVVSLIGLLLVVRMPESRPQKGEKRRSDVPGIVSLAVAVLALQLVITFGPRMGVANVKTWVLVVVLILATALFIKRELSTEFPFIDLHVFRVPMFTGAIATNFCAATTAGVTTVTMWTLQRAHGMPAGKTGVLALGFGIMVVLFIRLGEKIMLRRGFRLPIVVGIGLMLLSALLFSFTFLPLDTFTVLAAITFAIYGFGLALYATPVTTAALEPLPQRIAGAGSAVFKMTSSLGAAVGLGLSATVFTAVAKAGGAPTPYHYSGSPESVAVMQAGFYALLVEAVLMIVAIVVTILTVGESEKNTAAVRKLAADQAAIAERNREEMVEVRAN